MPLHSWLRAQCCDGRLHHGRFDLTSAAGRATTLPGVEHHRVDVQTGSGPVRLHLAATGSGPPVLLLHGWPQHWWCWRRVVKQLRDYRLLIPDLRGFGWSEAPGSGYSPTGFADDAVALLDALDITRAHVIGHDWGGFVGFLLGLHHSDIGCCCAIRRWPSAGMVCGAGRKPDPGPPGGGVSRLHPLVSAARWPGGIVSDADAAVYADQFRDRARTAASSQLYRSYWRLAQAILLRRAFEGQRLEAPTQVPFGANDFYIPVAVLEEIEAHGTDLTLEVVEGCSHWMPEERPDLITDRARALFGRQ